MSEIAEAIDREITQERESFEQVQAAHQHRLDQLRDLAERAAQIGSALPGDERPPEEANSESEPEEADEDPGSEEDDFASDGSLDAHLLEVISRAYPGGLRKREVTDLLPLAVNEYRLKAALKRLIDQNKITTEGERAGTKYLLAHTATGPEEPESLGETPSPPEADRLDEPNREPEPDPDSMSGTPRTRDEWKAVEEQVMRCLNASSKAMKPSAVASTLDIELTVANTAITALKGQGRIHLVRTLNGDKYEPAGKR